MEHLASKEEIIGKIKAAFTGGDKWAGLGVRTISGVTLAALVLSMLWGGGFLFAFIIVIAALQMLREWDKLTINEDSVWRAAGMFYIAIPCAAILWLRNVQVEGVENAGFKLVLYLLFAVWATDIGAYFTGRIVGGAKLAPSISPGKTWAGLGGGMAAAAVVGGISFIFTPYPTKLVWAIVIAVLLAGVAQAGDLFESWVKRRAGVKDADTRSWRAFRQG